MTIKPGNLIFNIEGDDRTQTRKIWGGNTTNLMNLNNVKYGWALKLYQQMRENFWIPQKFNLTQDVTDYQNLTEEERRAYNGILSYLTFLDSIQTCNIPYLKSTITAPEVSLCMAEQISQEGMHNHAYQYIIETIISEEKRNDIYEQWREDTILRERCQYVSDFYQKYIDDPTDFNLLTSLFANYLLEGLYFYPGFIFFYNLASRQLMAGTSDIIRTINRDELSHVRLYQSLLPEAMQTFSISFSSDMINQMVRDSVNHELKWSQHIIGDGILGINSASTEQYLKYLANARLKAIGLEPIYDSQKNPYAHLERFADTKGDADTKSNFFESTVTSYMMSEALEGWNEF